MIAQAEERPPYVVFEKRPVEDREASNETGHFVAKDIDYAIITPQGSKDRIERIATEWLQKLRRDVDNGRFPAPWFEHFKKQYELWRNGQELPLEGTAIQNWPPASPAEVKNLLAANIRTVEDLAAANEEAIHRLGMGARALKQRAVAWLQAAESTGKASGVIAGLQSKLTQLETRCEQLEEQNAALRAQVKALETAE